MTLTAKGLLDVRLFGTPRLKLNGTALVLPTKRALGVVAYLALEGATSREKLADLLWDEFFFENPKRNLRQELYRLSQTPLSEFLDIGEVIELHCQCDARLASQNHHLVSHDFLSRFDVPQAPSFNQWLQMQRETFSKLRLAHLQTRAASLTGLAALNVWLEVLQLDALREDAVRQILKLEAQLIGLHAARERYNDFKQFLKSELGLAPLPETQVLARDLGLIQDAPLVQSDGRIERILEACSLLGQPFEAHMLLDVTGLTDFEVLETLEKAAQIGLLQRTQTGFTLLQAEQTTQKITLARRKILERRIAKRLSILGLAPQIIAVHLERAGETNKAAEKYFEAAELATRQNHTKEAMECYNKVFELGTDLEQRFAVLMARVALARGLDSRIWRETIRDLEREARLRTPEHRVMADLERAAWHFSLAEYEKTLEFILPHINRSDKAGGLAAYWQGTVMTRTGKLTEAKTYLERALNSKNAITDAQNAEVHNTLCVLAIQQNNLGLGKIHNQKALKGFARSGLQQGLTRALSTAGVLEMLAGQYKAATRMFKRSLENAQSIGDVQSQLATLLNLSKANFETNHPEASRAYLEQGLELLKTNQDPNIEGSYLVNLAALERTQLRLDSAWTRVETALEYAKAQGVSPKIASRSLIMADLAIERHKFEEARTYLALAAQHIIPEFQAALVLEEAKLELFLGQPQRTLELLQNLECQNDNLEYRAALLGLAYLDLKQPLETIKYVETQTSTIYLPLLQTACIEAHAVLGTLREKHFEPLPNKQSMPYMRYKLFQAFSQHHPDKSFKKEALRLEKMLGKSSRKY
ncbi:MAG: hypothetical protein RLZZ156_1075 [Deinococcota bacterium]|jgi:DNA-binding SARP family transcriptional activator